MAIPHGQPGAQKEERGHVAAPKPERAFLREDIELCGKAQHYA